MPTKVKTACLDKIFSLYRKHKNLAGYIIAASSGVLVQYLVGTTLLINIMGWGTTKAIAAGFIASLPVGFFMTKLLAFDAKESGKTKRELVKYAMTVVASLLITTYGSVLSIHLLHHFFGDGKYTIPIINWEFSPAGSLGHFMGMGMSFVFNYIVHKKFTFVDTGLLDRLRAFIK